MLYSYTCNHDQSVACQGISFLVESKGPPLRHHSIYGKTIFVEGYYSRPNLDSQN